MKRLRRLLRWTVKNQRLTPAYTVDETGLLKISPTAKIPEESVAKRTNPPVTESPDRAPLRSAVARGIF